MSPLTRVQRTWFFATFVCGCIFIAVLPPFQGNDETGHWRRLWAIAQGDVYCNTIPEAANLLPEVTRFPPAHSTPHYITTADLRQAFDYRGYNIALPLVSPSCTYAPHVFLPGAVVARAAALTWSGRPRDGGMITAFYLARLVGWILVSVAAWFSARRLQWARNLLLAFYSIPEVLQESVTLGNDWFLLAGAMLYCAYAFSAPRWRHVAVVFSIVVLMTLSKPVFWLLVLVCVPMVLDLTAANPVRWRHAILWPALLVPLAAWKLWMMSIPSQSVRAHGPRWTHPASQIATLHQHPLFVVHIWWQQLAQTFTDPDVMHGRWTSVFGSFGWNAFQMPLFAYYLLLAAIAAAIIGDLALPEAMVWRPRTRGWSRFAGDALAAAGALAANAATVVAMYIYFTAPTDRIVNGVQGRYYLPSLIIFAVIGLHWAPRPQSLRSAAKVAVPIAALTCVIVNLIALHAIRAFYWRPPA